MNKFLEEVVAEAAVEEQHNELTFEDGVFVAEAEHELVAIENDFNTYYNALGMVSKDMDSATVEALAIALETTPEVVNSLAVEEEDGMFKKAAKAVLNFIKSVAAWIKDKAVKMYQIMFDRMSLKVNYVKENIDCEITDADIKEHYKDDKKKQEKALKKFQEAKSFGDILIVALEKYNQDLIISDITEDTVKFKNRGEGEDEEIARKDIPAGKLTSKILEHKIFDKKGLDVAFKEANNKLKEAEKKANEAKDQAGLDEAKYKVKMAKSDIEIYKTFSKLVAKTHYGVKVCVEIKDKKTKDSKKEDKK